jgi:OmpA-OmpF porin, OOP family
VSNGIDINRVETSGLGSAKPIAENTTETGRKKNRRVELLIHDGE